MNEETLTYYGDTIKALGDGRIGGYLVRFGNEKLTDLESEFFTKSTDFGDNNTSDIYYQHGLDPQLKKRVLGKGETRIDDVGVWIEAQLKMRDEYERAIYKLVSDGKMGWSSGTAGHLVERENIGNARHIKRWVLGLDASITPTPAEPRTSAIPIKSFDIGAISLDITPEAQSPDDLQESDSAVKSQVVEKPLPIQVMENNIMPENEPVTHVTVNPMEAQMKTFSDQMAEVMKFIEQSPRIQASGFVSQDGGTADKNIKNFGDFALAVKRGDHKRLTSHYGSIKGQVEGTGVGGGYLIPEEFMNELQAQVSMMSAIVSRVRLISVSAPSGSMPALDQFVAPSAGTGQSAFNAGIDTNKRAEGGSYGEETAAFSTLNWFVSDVLSGYVTTTRELSEDAPAIGSLLGGLIASAQQSKLEYYILNGLGGGEPLGIFNADALVTVDAATDNAWVLGDAVNMLSRFKGMGAPVWVVHPSALPDIVALANGSGAVSFTPNLQSPLGMQLLGYPIIMSEHVAQTNNPKDISLIDFSSYYLFERGAAYLDFSEHANFTTGKDTWRFGQRVDGKPAVKNVITLADATGTFTVSPFVTNGD